ncbi:helix-turn-helix domain-containing protein [Paenibacillus protaetiae]|uniref:AraC family transcriptional regulator n=1 Tax=Paenibacillus protaetiae TaxID=2509456 RepID=A0A4P6ESG4_9BACL|nr:AraC family transcriptional regulator [Paenibacillus protaetiae]QAY65365.1 AraC family transcriptional regulator [Paenibacillus protaetiae]
MFLIPVGVSHVFRPAVSSRPLIVYNCVVAADRFRPILLSFPGGKLLEPLLDEPDWQHYHDGRGECRMLFHKLHDEYSSKRPGWEAGLFAAVLELLLYLHRCPAEEGKQAHPTSSPGMEAALRVIHTRFDAAITVKEIAELAALGERQFLRKLKARTGMTFIEYVQSVRMDKACLLLRTTDRKMADIAAAAGYQDIGYFNRLFRRVTGLSPSEYRKEAAARSRHL